MSNRGRIGVVVATDANAEKDRIGARIEAVTPGGPADDAGLKAGDIVTKFNGTALGGVRDEDEEVSGPGNKLVELAHELEPGDTARVEYRRGTENKTATIIAEDLGGWRMEMPNVTVTPRFEFPQPVMPGFGGENNFSFVFGSPWGGLEMVTLNAELGEYFGAQEGVLVVKAPGDSSLPLKGGDVILAIDGRKPTSPSHAMRILGSYDEGEAVKIDVMRRQRRTTVTWTVPDHESRMRTTTPRARRPRGQSGEQSFFKFEPGTGILPLKVNRGLAVPMAKVASLRLI
jgi:S1-C subfamily serine protease